VGVRLWDGNLRQLCGKFQPTDRPKATESVNKAKLSDIFASKTNTIALYGALATLW
jgi:hypothetical protein